LKEKAAAEPAEPAVPAVVVGAAAPPPKLNEGAGALKEAALVTWGAGAGRPKPEGAALAVVTAGAPKVAVAAAAEAAGAPKVAVAAAAAEAPVFPKLNIAGVDDVVEGTCVVCVTGEEFVPKPKIFDVVDAVVVI